MENTLTQLAILNSQKKRIENVMTVVQAAVVIAAVVAFVLYF